MEVKHEVNRVLHLTVIGVLSKVEDFVIAYFLAEVIVDKKKFMNVNLVFSRNLQLCDEIQRFSMLKLLIKILKFLERTQTFSFIPMLSKRCKMQLNTRSTFMDTFYMFQLEFFLSNLVPLSFIVTSFIHSIKLIHKVSLNLDYL